MSFSSDVKGELCRERIQRSCCARAEACGVLLFCNQFSPTQIRIVTESQAFSARLSPLFRKAFSVDFDEKIAPVTPDGKQIFLINQPEKLAKIWDVCGGMDGGIALHLNFALLEEQHCRISLLRGAFLAGGSATAPQKGYHLELVTSHYYVSRELTALLLDMGYQPKDTTRKSNYITYFKQSEHIEDLLVAMDAPQAAMEIMNTKAEKTLRNGINRRVNCDAANADKTVDAAQEQLAAIRILEARGALESLSEKLQETAKLRQEYPELALSDLATLCNPPVTKSCLNHRLRKLLAMGRELEQRADY